jgi:hypothetical protein
VSLHSDQPQLFFFFSFISIKIWATHSLATSVDGDNNDNDMAIPELLTVVLLKIQVFWDVMMYPWISGF